MAITKPKGPFLPDPKMYLRAGIEYPSGKPTRASSFCLKEGIKKVLRVIDQQDAVNRYKWYNLPCNLTSEEVETLLYYNGSLAFFYFKELDKFFFMPYTLNGKIDFYGRFNRISPVPIAATSGDGADKKRYEDQAKILSALKLNVVKAPIPFEELKIEDLDSSAVLLYDYSKQRSQTILSRQMLNESIIDVESDIIPFLRTSMIEATGVRGMKVEDADTADEARKVSAQLYEAALSGDIYSPFTAKMDVQDLAEGSPTKSEEFLLTLTALDNFRLGTYGIKNGGLFQKKAHELQSESDMNGGNVQTIYNDGLALRQHFCNIVNSIWGTSIWCSPSEAILGQDLNMDGKAYDEDLGNSGGTSQAFPMEDNSSGGEDNA